MPPEASRDLLVGMRPANIATEVFAYGRVPLAYSARCFTARRFNLQKDTCEFKCIDFPDGMTISTREGQEFLSLNGIQTQSAKGIQSARRSARSGRRRRRDPADQPAIDGNRRCAGRLPRRIDGNTATLTGDSCNGFWHGRPGLEMIGKAA